MKKKIFIAILIIALVFASLLGLIFFRANSLINANRGLIESTINKTTGIAINLGEIDLSISLNPSLNCKAISIGKTTTNKGLVIGDLDVKLELVPLIKGNLVLNKITLNNTNISAEKKKEGFVIAGLESLLNREKLPKQNLPQEAIENKKTETSNKALPITLNLNYFKLSDAKITLAGVLPDKTIEIKNLTAETSLNFEKDILLVKDLNITATALNLPINLKIPLISINKTNKNIEIKELLANILKGAISAAIELKLDSSKSIGGLANISNIDLELAQGTILPDFPVKISGILNTNVKNYNFNLSDLPGSFSTSKTAKITDLKLKNLNIIKSLLDSLKNIPIIGETLFASLPATLQSVYNSSDTIINSIDYSGDIKNKTINIQQLNIHSDLFNLNLLGTLGFDLSINASADLILEKKISSSIVEKLKESAALVNTSGQMILPLNISGSLKKPLILPNKDKITKIIGKEIVKEKVNQLIDKAIKNPKLKEIGKGLSNLFGSN